MLNKKKSRVKGNAINHHARKLRSRIQDDNELNNTNHFRIRKPFNSLSVHGGGASDGKWRERFTWKFRYFGIWGWRGKPGRRTAPRNELLWRARRSADGANQETSQSAGLTRAVGCYPDSSRLLRDSSISGKKRPLKLKDARCHASPGCEELKVSWCKMVQFLS